MKLEPPWRGSLFIHCSTCIGVPVLKQSLIPSCLLVSIVVMKTVGKRVLPLLPVRLTIHSEVAQEPVGFKKLCKKQATEPQGCRINDVLLLWDFCNMGFLHYKNRGINHAYKFLLCAQGRFESLLILDSGRGGTAIQYLRDLLIMFCTWTSQKLMKFSLQGGHSTNLKHSKSCNIAFFFFYFSSFSRRY